MIVFAMIVLAAWMPIVVAMFAAMRPHRALIAAYLISTLFIPSLQINLPGLPDYTKIMATGLGSVLGSLLFDPGRLLRVKARWFDLPAIAWCLCPLASALSNDLGWYAGFSNVLEYAVSWAVPYWLGRAYLTTPAQFRDLGFGLVFGGMAYAPLCLLEVRLSPILNAKIYGFAAGAQGWEGLRYGGFRPRVFMSHGLELGMFYTLVMMVSYRSWAWGVIRTIGGWPFGSILLGLGFTTLLCKGTGAILLLIVGLGILWAARKAGRSWPVWVLILTPIVYAATRTSGTWSGQQVTDLAARYLDEERVFSLQTRLDNEVILIDKAHQRPIFGWGGYGRNRVYDASGRDITITDGWWIITLGVNGYVGLVSLLACYAVPIVILIRRHPVATWTDPDLVPIAAMAITLGLYSVDNLSNAIPTTINPLIAGGLVSLPATPKGRGRSRLKSKREAGDRLAGEGWLLEATAAYREAIAAAPGRADDADTRRELATTHSRLADALEAGGAVAEAEADRLQALALREALAIRPGADAQDHRELATALEELARNLAGRGRDPEAEGLRRRAVELRAGLAPASAEDYDRWVASLNDLAWLLATSTDHATRDADRAVLMAERAAREAPHLGSCWNTLGVARYRAGDERGAVEALERSIQLGPPGGTAFDLLVLAMARHRLGDAAGARAAFDLGAAWADLHRPGHPGLALFREEARGLIAGSAGLPALIDRT